MLLSVCYSSLFLLFHNCKCLLPALWNSFWFLWFVGRARVFARQEALISEKNCRRDGLSDSRASLSYPPLHSSFPDHNLKIWWRDQHFQLKIFVLTKTILSKYYCGLTEADRLLWKYKLEIMFFILSSGMVWCLDQDYTRSLLLRPWGKDGEQQWGRWAHRHSACPSNI